MNKFENLFEYINSNIRKIGVREFNKIIKSCKNKNLQELENLVNSDLKFDTYINMRVFEMLVIQIQIATICLEDVEIEEYYGKNKIAFNKEIESALGLTNGNEILNKLYDPKCMVRNTSYFIHNSNVYDKIFNGIIIPNNELLGKNLSLDDIFKI